MILKLNIALMVKKRTVKFNTTKIKGSSSSKPSTAATTPKLDTGIGDLIKQFGEMKIMLSKAVEKGDKMELTQKWCHNCRTNGHLAVNCTSDCKTCNGKLGAHPFYRCPDFKSTCQKESEH